MHRLVAEDAGGSLGEVAVAEQRNRAEIGAHGALLSLSALDPCKGAAQFASMIRCQTTAPISSSPPAESSSAP